VRAIGTVTAAWKVAATCAGLSIDLLVPLQGAVDMAACSITQHFQIFQEPRFAFQAHFQAYQQINSQEAAIFVRVTSLQARGC